LPGSDQRLGIFLGCRIGPKARGGLRHVTCKFLLFEDRKSSSFGTSTSCLELSCTYAHYRALVDYGAGRHASQVRRLSIMLMQRSKLGHQKANSVHRSPAVLASNKQCPNPRHKEDCSINFQTALLPLRNQCLNPGPKTRTSVKHSIRAL